MFSFVRPWVKVKGPVVSKSLSSCKIAIFNEFYIDPLFHNLVKNVTKLFVTKVV